MHFYCMIPKYTLHQKKSQIYNKRTCAFVGAAEDGLLTVSWAAFRNRSKAASVLLCNLSCKINIQIVKLALTENTFRHFVMMLAAEENTKLPVKVLVPVHAFGSSKPYHLLLVAIVLHIFVEFLPSVGHVAAMGKHYDVMVSEQEGKSSLKHSFVKNHKPAGCEQWIVPLCMPVDSHIRRAEGSHWWLLP